MLERNTVNIDKFAEIIGSYAAGKRALQITRNYEGNQTFFEKWIKDNPIKLQQMQQEREFQSAAIDIGIQAGVKSFNFLAKKGLKFLDDRHVRESVWFSLYSYGITLTDQNVEAYRTVYAQLLGYYCQLYRPRNNPTTFSAPKKNKVFIPQDDVQRANMAQLFYRLFWAKHSMHLNDNDVSGDLENLLHCFLMLGYDVNSAQRMITQLEAIEQSGVSEGSRSAQLLQSLYSNLTISLPTIDISRTSQNIITTNKIPLYFRTLKQFQISIR